MRRFLISLSMLLMLSAAAFACCGDPITVDLDSVLEHAARSGREPIEGLWNVSFDWYPQAEAVTSYTMAIVRNEYGVYKNADYLGVSTCREEGCLPGEVAMLFTRTDDAQVFDAVVVTENGFGRGNVRLLEDGRGRKNALLDTSDVKYSVHTMMERLLRVK